MNPASAAGTAGTPHGGDGSAAPPAVTVLRGGTVIDGTGAAPRRADVAVRAGRIVGVAAGLPGGTVVDCTGKTLLPGLFDCHVHVTGSGLDLPTRMDLPFSYQFYAAMANLRATLECGITTARDADGADLGVKLALQRGLIAGPRLQISVNMISQTGGHGDGWRASGNQFLYGIPHPGRPDGTVDGPDQMRRKVREMIRAGADVIKVCASGGTLSPTDSPDHAQFQPDELAAAVTEAAAQGRAVMAHAVSPPGIINALQAGVRSIEHGTVLDDRCLELLLQHDAWLVPTLSAGVSLRRQVTEGMRLSPSVIGKMDAAIDVQRQSFARAVAAGVKIAMGTDSGVTPHGENLLELHLMHDYGMAPGQVIVAATSSAARLLGVDDDRGTLQAGKRADIVVVDGDPFEFATLKERITAVYQDGVPVA